MTVPAERFDNTYAALPPRFYEKLPPTRVQAPALVKVNADVAELLGLDKGWLQSESGVAMLAGNHVPEGADPLAMAYSGHQFGGWAPRLGDGRAILLGELQGSDGHRYDLQLKGAGRTPFSRGGDGRAWIGPVLREYIVSEAMAALNIPTTRSLAAVTTGEQILRDGYVPGAVLTRVARSHIRVGTFEYFAARRDEEGLRLLADYVIERFHPHCADEEQPYVALLKTITEKQATLVASWQWVGFIHGVMNTDNTNVSGETIDYGPCAFLDNYQAGKTFSSIDSQGRYAYSNQPRAAQWNLAVLAQCLLPLIQGNDESEDTAIEKAQAVVDDFPTVYQTQFISGMRRKLGLADDQEDDLLLGSELLELMESSNADFTLTFYHLYHYAKVLRSAATDDNSSKSKADSVEQTRSAWSQLFEQQDAANQWLETWQSRIDSNPPVEATSSNSSRDAKTSNWLETMRLSNPALIPRNHNIEHVIAEAAENDNYTALEELLSAVCDPFDSGLSNTASNSSRERLMLAPQAHEEVSMTFCGT